MRNWLQRWFVPAADNDYTPPVLQKAALSVMLLLVVLTFAVANLQALFFVTSDWLISTILPAVVVEETNDERAASSVATLTQNPTLSTAATRKAKHMAENGYFAHYSPDGVTPWHWFAEVGYEYAHAGENLAVHFTDSDAVVEAWMDSPAHRENIVNGDFTEIGVGTARGEFEGYPTVFVVQLFGTPAASSVAAATDDAAVPSESATGSTAATTTEPRPTTRPTTTPETILAQAQTATGSAPQTPRAEAVLAERAAAEPAAPPVASALQRPGTSSTATTAPTDRPATTTPETATTTDVAPVADGGGRPARASTSPATEMVVQDDNTVSVYTEFIATSSGLAPAGVAPDTPTVTRDAGWSAHVLSSLLQPQLLLQIVYGALAAFVALALLTSIVLEIRHQRPLQIAYGIGLLLLMGGLYYTHVLITKGVLVA